MLLPSGCTRAGFNRSSHFTVPTITVPGYFSSDDLARSPKPLIALAAAAASRYGRALSQRRTESLTKRPGVNGPQSARGSLTNTAMATMANTACVIRIVVQLTLTITRGGRSNLFDTGMATTVAVRQ